MKLAIHTGTFGTEDSVADLIHSIHTLKFFGLIREHLKVLIKEKSNDDHQRHLTH